MGRKPNALIGEFFERGAKLEDSSNRYQHTCRSCGEKFPKGRLDSLTTHLLKKCPAISQAARAKAVASLTAKPNQNGTYNQIALVMSQQPAGLADVSSTPQPNMSALETLAEVSRQQLDSNGQYVPAGQNPNKRKRGATRSGPAPGQQQMMHEQMLRGAGLEALGIGGHTMDNDLEHVLREINQFTNDQNSDNTSQSLVDPTLGAPIARMASDALIMDASAPNDVAPKGEGTGDLSALTATAAGTDGGAFYQFPSQPSGGSMIDPQLQDDDSSMTQMMEDSLNGQGMLQPRPSSVNPNLPQAQYMNDFSLHGDQQKHKTRTRFTPDRRKEVQEVRKQGACIRCRMLKKPCSGGTPCSTCRSVESARLWKSPCMRARIADEFDLYSAGLHNVLAFHELNQFRSKINFQPSENMIEATHFPETDLQPAVLHSVKGRTSDEAGADPFLVSPFDPTQLTTIDIELLNHENETAPMILDQYIRRVERNFFENEPSTFMRPTLLLASDLAQQKVDPLLTRALDLWVGTQILVDQNLSWSLYSTFFPPDALESPQRSEPLASNAPLTYRLLTFQLRAYIEKRCANIAKGLMNDLERRLLQRQQSPAQHFETFLTAIIMLNCVEKTCWYFSTWRDKAHEQPEFPGGTNVDNTEPSSEAGGWPLERNPSHFVEKGNTVASVVSMLLRMRGVPPTTVIGDDGMLHLDTSAAAGKKSVNDDGQQELGVERNVVVATWFESVGMKVHDLMKAQGGEVWNEHDCRCWELRYVSRLFNLT